MAIHWPCLKLLIEQPLIPKKAKRQITKLMNNFLWKCFSQATSELPIAFSTNELRISFSSNELPTAFSRKRPMPDFPNLFSPPACLSLLSALSDSPPPHHSHMRLRHSSCYASSSLEACPYRLICLLVLPRLPSCVVYQPSDAIELFSLAVDAF